MRTDALTVIHSLASRLARKEGDKTACPIRGLQRVTTTDSEITCLHCRCWAGVLPTISDDDFLRAVGIAHQ